MQLEINNIPEAKRKISLERLPTNTLSAGSKIQRWANFIAGFSIEFVENCLSKRSKENDVVIDPFLGCGTTLVGARNLGFKGIGFEAHKLFYTLAASKLNNYSIDDLNHIITTLKQKNKKISWSESAHKFIDKMFLKSEKEKISYASYQLTCLNNSLKPLGVALFLKSCELTCTAQTDGIYKAPDSKKKSIAFESALDQTFQLFEQDITSSWYNKHWENQPLADIHHHTSESLAEVEDSSVGICITSPPYLNNFDYAEMTRLQLYLLGWADSWGDISEKVRNKLITNTTTALKDKKSPEFQNKLKANLPSSLTIELEQIVAALSYERGERAGKKEYDYLVYPYYYQINSVLKELYRTLKPSGEVHWVVADAALYGVHIKTHIHTKQLMEDIGFSDVKVKWLRKRGHRWILSKRDGAKEALGEYHLTAKKPEVS